MLTSALLELSAPWRLRAMAVATAGFARGSRALCAATVSGAAAQRLACCRIMRRRDARARMCCQDMDTMIFKCIVKCIFQTRTPNAL